MLLWSFDGLKFNWVGVISEPSLHNLAGLFQAFLSYGP